MSAAKTCEHGITPKGECLDCRRAQSREWRRAHPNRPPNRPGKKLYTLEAQLKRTARSWVYSGVRSGRIVKPEHCSECDCRPLLSRNLHAHHEDYTKPDEYEWLCVGCHGKRHSEPSLQLLNISSG